MVDTIAPLDVNVAVQQVVTVMTFSVFAQSLGLLMAGGELTKTPGKTKASEVGLASLREAFGADVVARALVKVADKTDVVSIARATEIVVLEDLHKQYTDFEIDTAMKSCPAGDFVCVKSVAYALHNRGVTPVTRPAETTKVASTSANRYVKMRRPPVKVKDTKTGVVYDSLAAMGKANAAEYGFDPKDSFIGYKVLDKDPKRFVRV